VLGVCSSVPFLFPLFVFSFAILFRFRGLTSREEGELGEWGGASGTGTGKGKGAHRERERVRDPHVSKSMLEDPLSQRISTSDLPITPPLLQWKSPSNA
jgi:hypothetical protein